MDYSRGSAAIDLGPIGVLREPSGTILDNGRVLPTLGELMETSYRLLFVPINVVDIVYFDFTVQLFSLIFI